MPSEYANLVILLISIILIVCFCVVYVAFRTLACRASCWYHAVEIEYIKQPGDQKHLTAGGGTSINNTNMIRKNSTDTLCIEDGTFEDDVCVTNVDNICCLHFSWNRYGKKTKIVRLPEAKKVRYGEIQSEISMYKQLMETCSKFPSQSKNDTCPICLEVFLDGCCVVLLKCSHGYHDACLSSWLESAAKSRISCPMCKKDIHADRIQEKTPLTVSTFSYSSVNTSSVYPSSVYPSYIGYNRMIASYV